MSGRIHQALIALGSPLMRRAMRLQPCGQVSRHLNVAPDQRYVYVSNPKVGTSSIKSLLIADALGGGAAPSRPHDRENDPFLALHTIARFRPLERLADGDTKFVTVVRNPFARLHSAYQSKIVSETQRAQFAPLAIEGWTPGHGLPTFDSFVRAVCAQQDRRANPHWRLQATQTMVDVFTFDFIGHLEYFDEDMRTMCDLIGVTFDEAPHRNSSPPNSAPLPYSDALAELVIERYARDFELFGYSTSLAELAPVRRLSSPLR